MSSTLRVTNVSDTTGGTSTNLMSGLAKAWANYDGTGTPALETEVFNSSSLTDNAAGDHTVNYTSALDSSIHAVLALQSRTASNAQVGAEIASRTTSSARISHRDTSGTGYDEGTCCMAAMGDLA